jgi:WD40 repeat protein
MFHGSFADNSDNASYQQKLIYESYEYTNSQEIDGIRYDTPESGVTDSTTVVVNPTQHLILTYSKQYVKVFESRTGQLLQTLVSPPMDYSKKKPRLSDKSLVSKADWSRDGKTLYVIGADGRTISLWGLLL